MRVITVTKIKESMQKNPQWRVGLQLWIDTFNKAGLSFESYHKIKAQWKEQSNWNTDRIPAQKIADNNFQGNNYDLYVFDIHKNECRIITRIDTLRNKIFIRHVCSHADYDKWCKNHIK